MDGYTLDETTRTAHKGGIRMDGKMECPICKKRALFVGVHDDEGNYHGLVGCEYENDPWSGLSYALHLEGWGDCPLCTDGAYSAMGGMLFDTSEEAISALTPPNEWISVEERLPPNMDDVLVVVRDNGECWTATGYYSSMSKVWYAVLNGQDTQMDVLWWMPFPASPDSRQPEGEV